MSGGWLVTLPRMEPMFSASILSSATHVRCQASGHTLTRLLVLSWWLSRDARLMMISFVASAKKTLQLACHWNKFLGPGSLSSCRSRPP